MNLPSVPSNGPLGCLSPTLCLIFLYNELLALKSPPMFSPLGVAAAKFPMPQPSPPCSHRQHYKACHSSMSSMTLLIPSLVLKISLFSVVKCLINQARYRASSEVQQYGAVISDFDDDVRGVNIPQIIARSCRNSKALQSDPSTLTFVPYLLC